jgi:hypothetical protein
MQEMYMFLSITVQISDNESDRFKDYIDLHWDSFYGFLLKYNGTRQILQKFCTFLHFSDNKTKPDKTDEI